MALKIDLENRESGGTDVHIQEAFYKCSFTNLSFSFFLLLNFMCSNIHWGVVNSSILL